MILGDGGQPSMSEATTANRDIGELANSSFDEINVETQDKVYKLGLIKKGNTHTLHIRNGIPKTAVITVPDRRYGLILRETIANNSTYVEEVFNRYAGKTLPMDALLEEAKGNTALLLFDYIFNTTIVLYELRNNSKIQSN